MLRGCNQKRTEIEDHEAGLDLERKRVARQRNAFEFVYPSREKETLKNTMLQRAYDLMWDGKPEECDALLEFLPERDASAMLDCWERDQNDKTPADKYSQWYHRWMEN